MSCRRMRKTSRSDVPGAFHSAGVLYYSCEHMLERSRFGARRRHSQARVIVLLSNMADRSGSLHGLHQARHTDDR